MYRVTPRFFLRDNPVSIRRSDGRIGGGRRRRSPVLCLRLQCSAGSDDRHGVRERVNWRRAHRRQSKWKYVRYRKTSGTSSTGNNSSGASGGTGKTMQEPLEKRERNLYPQHEDHEIPPHGLRFCEEYPSLRTEKSIREQKLIDEGYEAL